MKDRLMRPHDPDEPTELAEYRAAPWSPDGRHCRHIRSRLIELTHEHGRAWVEWCANPLCAVVMFTGCYHAKCKRHLDGRQLLCELCGVDAT